jgi:hypothetical protein
MAKARTADGRVREWIEGVLAQAAQPQAAARTRPFVTNEARLAAAFPAEQQASVDLLVGLLASALAGMNPPPKKPDAERAARLVYDLTFAVLRRHLIHRTVPGAAEVDHVVRFSVRGAGGEPARGGGR